MRRTKPLLVRAEKFIERVPESGCWLWTGFVMPNGYGMVGDVEDGKCTHPLAHRAIWRAFNGPIPDGLCVLHRCDVRCCVNPAHLFLGTHLDNMRDMDCKGRRITPSRKGERNAFAKLTDSQVREIRASKESSWVLAPLFGVTPSAVQQARNGRRWSHVK